MGKSLCSFIFRRFYQFSVRQIRRVAQDGSSLYRATFFDINIKLFILFIKKLAPRQVPVFVFFE